MEEKKSNNFLINLLLVVIVITIIIMGISIYKLYVSNQELLKNYKTLSMKQSTTPSEIPEPAKLNVAGIYTSGFANLALFPNGTFRYTYSEDAELGTIGNYTINNNCTNSDVNNLVFDASRMYDI